MAVADALCPTAPNLPAEHGVPVHVLALVALVVAECFPDVHLVHAAAPVDDENVPAMQFVHTMFSDSVRPVGPLFPAAHAVWRQLTADGAAMSREYLPDSHTVQDDMPVMSAYFPAIQFVQVDAVLVVWPCGPTFPLAHGTPLQTVCPPLPPAYIPAVHTWHVPGATAARAAENLPTAQLTHSDMPGVAE